MMPGVTFGYSLDACVWINLLATGKHWDVISALAGSVVTADEVIREVKRDPITRALYQQDANHPLRASAHVGVASLNAIEQELFVDLVSGSALDALGDGEAAAIALAATRGLVLASDDKKARRVAGTRFPHLEMAWTVDLLTNPSVVATLGSDTVYRCLQDGVKHGRMHVPPASPAVLFLRAQSA